MVVGSIINRPIVSTAEQWSGLLQKLDKLDRLDNMLEVITGLQASRSYHAELVEQLQK